VLFVALGLTRKFVGYVFDNDPENLTNAQSALSGSFASIFSSLVVCPTELIKCKMQALKEMQEKTGKIDKSIGPWRVVKDMVRHEGPLSLYKGLTSTWAREFPGYFFFFYGYEMTKNLLTPPGTPKENISPVTTILAGGTAGLFLWVGIFPIDVVKTRIQVTNGNNFFKTLTTIVRKEGVSKLYSGLTPTVIRTYPANGALFLTLEYTKSFFYGYVW